MDLLLNPNMQDLDDTNVLTSALAIRSFYNIEQNVKIFDGTIWVYSILNIIELHVTQALIDIFNTPESEKRTSPDDVFHSKSYV